MEPDPIFPIKGGSLWGGALAASMDRSAEMWDK